MNHKNTTKLLVKFKRRTEVSRSKTITASRPSSSRRKWVRSKSQGGDGCDEAP